MINHKTTAKLSTYMKRELIAKLDADAAERGIPRNQLMNLIINAYYLEMETDEAKGVKENDVCN